MIVYNELGGSHGLFSSYGSLAYKQFHTFKITTTEFCPFLNELSIISEITVSYVLRTDMPWACLNGMYGV
jgi:hypothetical protein